MNLECPLPKLDFDVITLSHGSGGLLTQRLLNQCIFEQLDNEHLQKQDDSALIELKGKVAFSTDSFVVSPIFFPGGNIGDLAIHGTVNDLAVCGAKPKYLSLGLILEEGLRVEEFWQILVSIRKACEKAGVMIITGDTKVVEQGKGDKIFINTTGIGEVMDEAELGIERVKVSDEIIVTGPIACHGSAIMATREGMDFDTGIISDSAPLNKMIEDLILNFGTHIHFMRDATRGGVAAVLNEIVSQIGQGIHIWNEKIPVLAEVQDFCEILGLDPLYVANEGTVVMIVESQKVEPILNHLHKSEFGKGAAAIGKIIEEDIGKVILHSDIGGTRVVHMPLAEQLPRIC